MNRALYAIAGAVTLVLVVFAGGYGYHRDELYFLEAGRHLAWSYADQGPVRVDVCRGPQRPWSAQWSAVKHLG